MSDGRAPTDSFPSLAKLKLTCRGLQLLDDVGPDLVEQDAGAGSCQLCVQPLHPVVCDNGGQHGGVRREVLADGLQLRLQRRRLQG